MDDVYSWRRIWQDDDEEREPRPVRFPACPDCLKPVCPPYCEAETE